MDNLNARSNAELAAARAAAIDEMVAYRAHLKVIGRPFGIKDGLLAVGAAIVFMWSCLGIALVLHWATR